MRIVKILLWLLVVAGAAAGAGWWFFRPAEVDVAIPQRGTAVEIVYGTGAVEPTMGRRVFNHAAAATRICSTANAGDDSPLVQ